MLSRIAGLPLRRAVSTLGPYRNSSPIQPRLAGPFALAVISQQPNLTSTWIRFASRSSHSPNNNSRSPANDRATDTTDTSTAKSAGQESVPEPSPDLDSSTVSRGPRKETESAENSSPFDTLPDLTQGIPSTLEYETTGASRSSLTAVTADSASGGGRGRGELPASAYVSSTDRKQQRLFKWTFLTLIASMVGGVVYMGRNWDEEEVTRHPEAPNGWGIGLWWTRSSTRWRETLTYYHEPAFEKLLPKVDPMLEKPYTLCISLEDMLVHSEWSRDHGWRVAKRPGVDYFLRYLSQYYELVLFTTVPSAIALPVIQKLDPFQMIMFPLFREATKYEDGELVKDLSYLNRDLSKVIILDTNATHIRKQPDNGIILPKWTGDTKDTELIDLIPFLEYIHTMQYGDVRKVLTSFQSTHIPTEFARREAYARAEYQKRLRADKKSPSGVGLIGKALGLKPSNMSLMVAPPGEQDPAEAFAQGKMLHDLARERGRRYVEMLDADIRENGQKYLKEQQQMMEQQQKEAMSSMMGWFSGRFVPPPKEDEKKDSPNGTPTQG